MGLEKQKSGIDNIEQREIDKKTMLSPNGVRKTKKWNRQYWTEGNGQKDNAVSKWSLKNEKVDWTMLNRGE